MKKHVEKLEEQYYEYNKEMSKVIKKDFIRFKDYILEDYQNNEELKEFVKFIIDNVEIDYSYKEYDCQIDISITSRFVEINFYYRDENFSSDIYELTKIIYNKNFKEFYKLHFLDNDLNSKVIKYSVDNRKVHKQELEYEGSFSNFDIIDNGHFYSL